MCCKRKAKTVFEQRMTNVWDISIWSVNVQLFILKSQIRNISHLDMAKSEPWIWHLLHNGVNHRTPKLAQTVYREGLSASNPAHQLQAGRIKSGMRIKSPDSMGTAQTREVRQLMQSHQETA